jgi:hypothetical protein
VSTRTTLALLAVLVALGAAAFFVQGPGRPDRAREHAAVFPGLKAEEVSLISTTRGGAEVLLTRAGGSWKLGAAKEPADAAAVEALLAGLVGARVGSVVSTNAGKQAVYETDAEKGIAVRLEGAGGKPLAAFFIGKRGPDFASCYLRRDGASEVLLVSRDLRLDFSRPAESWREPPKKAESSESGSPAPASPPAAKP